MKLAIIFTFGVIHDLALFPLSVSAFEHVNDAHAGFVTNSANAWHEGTEASDKSQTQRFLQESSDSYGWPAKYPTKSPVNLPAKSPTKSPTKHPTNRPSNNPTKSPTKTPSAAPVKRPTKAPGDNPTNGPVNTPTSVPVSTPTNSPTTVITTSPTLNPTRAPIPVAPSCAPKEFPRGLCNVSGDPATEQESCTPNLQETCDAGTWSASLDDTATTYDPIKDETTVTYRVRQVKKNGPPVSEVTVSWGGNCCVKSASYDGSSIDYGLERDTCAFGVTFDDAGFSDGANRAFHSVVFAGQPKLVDGAGTVTVVGGTTGFCTIPVKGVFCDGCNTDPPVDAPTRQPTRSPTTPPTNSPTEAPTSAPIPVRTPRPTPKPTTRPTKDPTRAPVTAPTRRPVSTPSPTTPPTNSPTTVITTSPTRNPTRAPIPVAPSCAPKEFPRGLCNVSGDPATEQESCTPNLQETCEAGTWSASLDDTATTYDPIKDETTVTYRVRQVKKNGPPVSEVTVSWGGNCCVKSASYDGSSIDYGLERDTCAFGVTFDDAGFSDGANRAFHSVVFAGQPKLVDGAGTVTVVGGTTGFCTIPVKGVFCDGCNTDPPVDAPTRQPTRSPTTPPTNSPTEAPTSAPIPVRTPRPTPKPTTRPTKDPTRAPVTAPTRRPVSTPSPTTPPTNSPTTVITTSPTRNPTRAPIPVAPSCAPKEFPRGLCNVSGDPATEQESCTPNLQETCEAGTWSASLDDTATTYDPIKDETTVTYRVRQVKKNGPPVSEVTVSWGGNCCVKSASYDGSSIDYGLERDTCAFGVTFDDAGFSDGANRAFHSVVFAGQPKLVDGAGTVTVVGGTTGFCTIPVKGVFCDGCNTDPPVDAPTRQPTRSPTTPPTNSPTEAPTSAPIPVRTPRPTPKPTTRPTKDPTRAPVTAPTRRPVSTPSPTTPPTNSPTTVITTSPTRNPTRAPIPVAPSCAPKEFPRGLCNVSGDPATEQESCTPNLQETCEAGTWSASLDDTATTYDPIKDETTVTYRVRQVKKNGPPVSEVTVSWGGNCCVKSASYDGSSIDYGLERDTCAFGVTFDDAGFSDGANRAFHSVVFAGQPKLVDGAGTVTVVGGTTGFCTIPVKGVFCDGCNTDPPVDAPTRQPTRSPTTPPTNSPTEAPTSAPIPVRTPRPTPKPTTRPTKDPTRAPVTAPTRRPVSTPSPTTPPTNSPTTVITTSPTRNPTRAPIPVAPSCAPKEFPRGLCNVSGDPATEQESCTPNLQETCEAGTWSASLDDTATTYDPIKDETTVTYRVRQVKKNGPPVSEVTVSWGGNCCVKSASYDGSSIDYGLERDTCAFGVTFDDAGFSDGANRAFHSVVFAGQPKLVDGAGTVTVVGGTTGFCTIPVKGVFCDGCNTDPPVDAPTRQPTRSPTTPPTNSPTEAPTSAPIPVRTPRPTPKPTTRPTKDPTRAPVTAPTRRPVSTPSPTTPPTNSPTTVITTSPTRNPTRAPIPVAPSCAPKEFPRGLCNVSGDPATEQESCTPNLQETCEAGTWSASLDDTATTYDPIKDETTVTYRVRQVKKNGPPVSEVTVSWGGNCCVKSASYDGSSIDYGLERDTCAFGVTFDDAGFSDGANRAFHSVVFAGQPKLVDGAGTVTVVGGTTGFCTIPVKGVFCDGCNTDPPVDAPTRQPTRSPTTPPTNSPTEAPTSAPIPVRTPRPTPKPTTRPTKDPTRAPVTAPTRRPVSTPSPTTPPTNSPTTVITTSPTRNPTRAPIPVAPSCAPKEFPRGLCNVSGDPATEQESCTPNLQETCEAGTWSASLDDTATTYDPIKDETTVTYRVRQVKKNGPPVSEVTVSWGGNCCVKSASYDGSSIDYGLERDTCAFGVTFDDAGFSDGANRAFHSVVFAGQPKLVDGAGTVTVVGGTTGFCTIPVKGVFCDGCNTDPPVDAPTRQPTRSPTTPPTNSPTEAPTSAPIPVRTPRPTPKPTTRPTKDPTRAPVTAPTRRPVSTPSPTTPPTNSPTTVITTSPTRNPTRAPIPVDPSCAPKEFPRGLCNVSGDPATEQESCTPNLQETCEAGTWSASLDDTATTYDPIKDETTVTYRVRQVKKNGPPVSEVTVSWGGNCCVKSASYDGSSIDYGLERDTCAFGVTFDDAGFSDGANRAFHSVVFAGQPKLVDGAGTVTVVGGTTGFCTIPVKGVFCDGCNTDPPVDAPTRQPTRSPTTPPTNSPTEAPTRAPIPVRTPRPTTSSSTSPSEAPVKEPTGGPETKRPTAKPADVVTKRPTSAPNKNPTPAPSNETLGPVDISSRSPTKSPTKSPNTALTKKPSRSPTIHPTYHPTKSPTRYPSKARNKGSGKYPVWGWAR